MAQPAISPVHVFRSPDKNPITAATTDRAANANPTARPSMQRSDRSFTFVTDLPPRSVASPIIPNGRRDDDDQAHGNQVHQRQAATCAVSTFKPLAPLSNRPIHV